MNYLQVAAIDVGYRNFACCILDNMTLRNPDPTTWKRYDLWAPKKGRRGKPTSDDLRTITRDWCLEHQHELAQCDVIVLERQMRKPFIIMNTVIWTIFADKVIIRHPMTVGTFWGLAKTREQKKADGVKTVLLNTRSDEFQNVPHKQDDMADTWLMCVYEMVQRQGLSTKELSFLYSV
jgi:hypothetical protein